jgi:hypothetical protein
VTTPDKGEEVWNITIRVGVEKVRSYMSRCHPESFVIPTAGGIVAFFLKELGTFDSNATIPPAVGMTKTRISYTTYDFLSSHS